ncbi:MAG: cyclase family protein [Synergistaceae bacterium]|jgi:kynurenine formamidase|nr:cyclase family protein [Synergistaceae bacterium]
MNIPCVSYGKIIDLSHPFDENMPSIDPMPRLDFYENTHSGLYNVETITYCPHVGTHMDAPSHVADGWGSIDSWPADILVGPAVVIQTGRPGKCEISASDITACEMENGFIEPGDAVLFHTRHSELWGFGRSAYVDDGYPCLSLDAADYLISRRVRYAAIDFFSPEPPDRSDIHRRLLGNGIPIVENVCNLEMIEGARCATIGTFPAVRGATGVWVRLLALV